jgi:hypothetical protein
MLQKGRRYNSAAFLFAPRSTMARAFFVPPHKSRDLPGCEERDEVSQAGKFLYRLVISDVLPPSSRFWKTTTPPGAQVLHRPSRRLRQAAAQRTNDGRRRGTPRPLDYQQCDDQQHDDEATAQKQQPLHLAPARRRLDWPVQTRDSHASPRGARPRRPIPCFRPRPS